MAKSKRKTARRRPLLATILVLACVGLVVLAGYTVYLDSQIRQLFEGARWSLPAKVYASPTQLFEGEQLSAKALVTRLERKGYRRSSHLNSSGTYRRRGGAVDVHTRAFMFWDGKQQARVLRVRFAGGRVSAIEPLDDGPDIAIIRLDPLLIGSIYPAGPSEDRILVKLGEVPPLLPAGLIMVEDRNFLDHFGISIKGILRAAWVNLRAGEIVQGGSTITQQLVKNLYLSNQQTFVRKAKEALMAILLDAHYSKDAILETYINEVYLGQDGGRAIHGFGLASYFYFDKPVTELQPAEIALLIGMVKGPSYYNPHANPERALARRNLVLEIFAQSGLLTPEQLIRARSQPLSVSSGGSSTTTAYPAFIDLVRKQLHEQYPDEVLTTEGLRIFTTLDPEVQAVAQRVISQGLRDLEVSRGISDKSLQAATVVTSVEGGRVLAVVGGRNVDFAGFNRAIDINRPIGSLMKPVVYLTALAQPAKYNVLTPLDDTRLTVKMPNGDVWQPDNYSHTYHGTDVPLYRALSHSYNVATSRLAMQLGLPSVVSTLKALGYPGDPPPYPSLALGAVGMSPLNVAQIYNTIAAGGFYKPLRAIRAVTTRQGEPLNRYPLHLRQVFSEQAVYLLTWILQRVTHYGTARSAYYTIPDSLVVAGKTGTTDGLRDSWFAGFSGNRVAVVWVGRDNDEPTPFTGAAGALQLWARIMRDIDARSLQSAPPRGIKTIPLVLEKAVEEEPEDSGLFGFGPDCSQAVTVPFMAGYVPEGIAPCGATRKPERLSMPAGGAIAPVEGQDPFPDPSTEQQDDSNWFEDLFQ